MRFTFSTDELEWLDSTICKFILLSSKYDKESEMVRTARKMKHKFRTSGQVNLSVKERTLLAIVCDIRFKSLATSLHPNRETVRSIIHKLDSEFVNYSAVTQQTKGEPNGN